MRPPVRQFPMPAWPNSGKYGWCKWCGDAIPIEIDGKRSTQRMWHPACVREFELRTRLSAQFDFLVKRDGRRCACCPEGTPEPMKWVWDPWPQRDLVSSHSWYTPEPEYLAQLWEDPCPHKPWADRTEVERATGEHVRVRREGALEVDHRVPLWEVADLPDDERRWYFGPGNLWLLCPTHHKAKTAREAARRAWVRKLERAQLSLDLG